MGAKLHFFVQISNEIGTFFRQMISNDRCPYADGCYNPKKSVLKTFFFFIYFFILFFEYLEYLVYLGRKLGSLFGAELARLRHLTRCFPPETLDANLAYFLDENLDDDLFRTSADSPTVQDKTTRDDGGI